MLIHVSEQSDIQLFEPRPSQYTTEPAVWAIDEARIGNYLVPRDCPRVTYYAGTSTTSADVAQFLGSSGSVVAIESGWWKRLQSCRLYCYYFSKQCFECTDACAGYFISHQALVPECVQLIDDPVSELISRGIELRIMPDLWSLRDAVVASSLSYSIIRMRNAQPRQVFPMRDVTVRNADPT